MKNEKHYLQCTPNSSALESKDIKDKNVFPNKFK